MDLSLLKLTPRRRQILEKMNVKSVEELLHTYPFRYESISASPFNEWQPGDTVAFEGLISSEPSIIQLANKRSMTRFKVISWDEEIQVTLFNRPWRSQFPYGKPITLFGIYQGKNQVTASSYNFIPLAKQQGLRPVYSLVKEAKQSDLKAMMKKALEFADRDPDLVPERLRKKYRLLKHKDALRLIHEPPDEKKLHQAIRTLKYEEFLCFQCVLQATQNSAVAGEPKIFDQNQLEEKVQALPYKLTADQRKALDDILSDLRSDTQMYRMVQGDVGCGKTAVASLSIEAARLAGVQSAFLAPTEILASQHLENLKKLGIPARLYASSLRAKEKREVLEELKSGKLQVVVGTHALFQENVEFDHLGLVIVDEQQRFGVRQRRSLIEKGEKADFLMMSATPIPRTYAHFLFGDIALSSIRTLPPGRKPVITHYVKGQSMGPILKEVLEGLREKRQLYVVCPAIEENPDLNLHAAEQIYRGMVQTFHEKVRVGLLHGKMKADEKEQVMAAFSKGELDVLVSTTVIEVGIDVPNATMMVIYDADRFGLSTLHQLRGRAARGKVQGECWLLSSTKDALAIERLKQMEVLLDGFSISDYDLKSRGPGDLLGTRQSGLPAFILGDFEKDPAIMECALEDARDILARQSDLPMLNYIRRAAETSAYLD